VTVARSGLMFITGGIPARETSAPGVSAIGLNECPVPMARACVFAEISSCNSATVCGR